MKLHELGCQVDLLERDHRIGGRIGIDYLSGREIDMGGKNIGRRYTRFRKLIDALGGAIFEPFGINTSRIVGGELLTVDSSHRTDSIRYLLRTCELRGLVKFGQIARKVYFDDDARFASSDLCRKLAKRYDAMPMSEHFGAGTVANLFRPATVRMNGAEPDEVYLGTFPTNVGLLLDSYDQVTGGLGQVLNRIGEFVRVRCDSEVQAVYGTAKAAAARVLVSTGGRAPVMEQYDIVALCTPAHATAAMVADWIAPLAALLRTVRYFQSTIAVVEYSDDVFGRDVRAVALDGQPCSNVGSYGMEDRRTLRYTFSGKHGRFDNPGHTDIAVLVDEAEAYLGNTIGLKYPKRTAVLTRHWPQSYCGYLPHYADFLDSVSAIVADLGNVALAGDYLAGTSLEACCRSGEAAAERLSRLSRVS
ncbi:FAD-dependent oxidoreductase [Mycobacterium paragordonae]|uniref:FAD-dependent oxidoreductase n=2 Tax=Mycobacterium TaxID=1763 RepID=UPI0027644FFE|nr:FAD-dependent oxidoreductase [Mycobacterium sp. TY813]